MSIVVEHEKRRKEILEKALEVFVMEGFEDTTFQKIADKCAITRTSLYLYFKNKKEVFSYSIKQLQEGVEDDIKKITEESGKSYTERLSGVVSHILNKIVENRLLFRVMLDHLLYLARTDGNPEKSVRRRTIRLRHILSNLIIEGEKKGEFRPMPVKEVNEFFYALLESAVFRVTVLQNTQVDDIKRSADMLIKSFKNID